ncbi:MAG: hypothetical protein MJ200_01315 [Mycoplasmoidaceae bacterium]|nr:hypothetical protein [Mycoplasmoidaceae bacterium]
MTKSDPDIYWDIESNFVGSTGQCHVTKDAKDEIDITLTGVDENKELWGIDFACGGVEVPIRGLVSVDDATNTIVITPHYIYCQIIPGLKLNLTFTYVNPSDVIHINQQTEMKTPGGDKKALQTNDIE